MWIPPRNVFTPCAGMMIVAPATEALTGQVAQALSNTRGPAFVQLNKNETIQVCSRN